MGLFDTDEAKKDLLTALGVEDGKTFADSIAAASTKTVNDIINAYDKRKSKDLESALKKVELPEGLTDKIQELLEAKEKGGGGDGDGDIAEGDLAKLPTWARALIETSTKSNKDITRRLEEVETARKEEKEKREAVEAKDAARAMSDAISSAATAKEAGLDPAQVPFLIPWLKAQGMVRLKEGSTDVYEMDTGAVDGIHGDKIFKPLADAMAGFAKTDTGKRFRPAKAGGGIPKTPDGKPAVDDGDKISVESLGGDPAAIREAAEKGLIDYGETS